jgi:acetoin utilization deacetylase AcuC-like enzyme
MTGEVRRAFAAVRPPGHHAEPNAAMGFCVFSNVAIATKYAVQKYGLKRVAIVDFDVHHGNGTQAVFQTDPSVLFISMHEDPHTLFPGTGFKWEIGSAEGKGFTLNIPMPLRSRDQEYLEVMSRCVIPKLKAFEPELMLVSAGFDAHRDDPLADEDLTEEGFGQMTRMLVETADEFCEGRIVSVLEGGYNLRALGRSVVSHLIAMA